MFGLKVSSNKKAREDGEKPFWISFSDLMSSLMLLFLVSMSVALLAVTNEPDKIAKEESERHQAIKEFLDEIDEILTAEEFKGIILNETTINFGQKIYFDNEGQNTLSIQQTQLLRQLTSRLLEKIRSTKAGKLWFKRAIVEGYASKSGTYLFNLNLSLERSERVICELLREAKPDEKQFTDDDRIQIATKFFVSGASFNDLRSGNDQLNRRVELKLEFKTRQDRINESPDPPIPVDVDALIKALNPNEKCPITNRLKS